MSRSLIHSFNSVVAKYSRLNKKVRKSISKGEFWRFTRRKRHYLLSRIERLKRRITELRLQLKLAGAGLAAGLLMFNANPATAQKEGEPSRIGPFIENRAKNPLPKPAFYRLANPALTFWDMDKDGDLDASMGTGEFENLYLYVFKNNGTKQVPVFDEAYSNEVSVQWEGTYQNPGRPAYADVDDDGDLDLVIGMGYYSGGAPDVEDDKVIFYRNIGTAEEPNFERQYSDDHPFYNMYFAGSGWPAFTDFDKDGDMDFVLIGDYYDAETAQTARLQFYENKKSGHASGVDAQYVRLEGAGKNPLYMGPLPGNSYFAVSFADVDGDGDEDFFAPSASGNLIYRRNDGGVFTEQEGNYTYKPGGQSTGNPLSISGLLLATPDAYKSFGFGDLDGDGDVDLVIGTNNVGTFNSPFIYVENTGNGVMKVDTSSDNPVIGFSMGTDTNGTLFDYDKDGDVDFLTTGQVTVPDGVEGGSRDIVAHMFFENNKGVFEPKTLINDPFAALVRNGNEGRWLTVDVDGDADIDALFLSRQFDSVLGYDRMYIEYYRNDDGKFNAVDEANSPLEALLATSPWYSMQLDFGDFNGDKLLDVVVFGYGDAASPRFFKNTGQIGAPVFVEENSWKSGIVNDDGSLNPKIIDVDSDGDNDLVLGKYNYIYYYRNIGTDKQPQWKEYGQTYESDGTTYNVENPFGYVQTNGGVMPDLADIDGDGDKDLFFANRRYGYFSFYENLNPAPTVAQTGALQIPYKPDENLTLDPTFTVSDLDGDAIVEIRVTIAPFDQGRERLILAGSHPNLVATFNNANGTLTISGSASLADYQAALRDIQYVWFSANQGERKSGREQSGRTLAKTITVHTLDADLTIAPSNTTTFSITHSNEQPAITPTGFLVSYLAAPIAVASTITLDDKDDIMLASAEVKIDAATYIAAQDRLAATFIGGITGSFNTTTGVLTITGSGTIADYQTVLRSVNYSNVLGAGGTKAARTVSIKVNDGESDSNVASVQVSVGGTNTAPTISGTATPFYISGEVVINNNIVVTDPDTVILNAAVVFTTGYNAAEDVLLFNDQNGIAGTFNSTAGLLSLSGAASPGAYQAALRSVRYKNNAAIPATNDRMVSFSVSDGGPQATVTGTTITVNKPPVIVSEDKKAAARGNVALLVSQVLSDPDNNLDLSTLVVTSQQGGTVSVDNGIITVEYESIPEFRGNDVITITVCDTGGRCSTTTLSVEVGAASIIYNGMSPNGDGINDWFTIQYLPKGTKVAIYNRWGDMIFETDDYDNNDPAKRFEGKNKNGTEVIVGTYFYKIKFPESKEANTGTIILNR